MTKKKTAKKTAKKTVKKTTKKKTAKKAAKKAAKKKTAKKVAKKKTAKKAATKTKTAKKVEKKAKAKKTETKAPKEAKAEHKKASKKASKKAKESEEVTDTPSKASEIEEAATKVQDEIAGLSENFDWADVAGAIASLDFFVDHRSDECLEKGCENLRTTQQYCRLHYIANWYDIKRKREILKEGMLQEYIEELISKYPPKAY